ncbi:MAG TPA: metalloregulator ArsR/SmtB family transcription factor [Myxococcaceae bacterium]|nr:metalloregulator ArsR/SmtB family transcription factor [Myxococcaceae bacterium]
MGADELLRALKAVAEPTRLRMLELLLQWHGPRTGPIRSGEPGLCLCDLELLVGMRHALVSHHLRILKEAGVVESEKRGRWTVYRARPEPLAQIASRLRGLAAPRGGPDSRAA